MKQATGFGMPSVETKTADSFQQVEQADSDKAVVGDEPKQTSQIEINTELLDDDGDEEPDIDLTDEYREKASKYAPKDPVIAETGNTFSGHTSSVMDSMLNDSGKQSAVADRFNRVSQEYNRILNELDEHPIEFTKEFIKRFVQKISRSIGLKKLQRTGTMVSSTDFDFIKSGRELMVYKYKGVSADVVIPSTVGGIPVTALHPDFLNVGIFSGGTLHSHRVEAIRSTVSGGSISNIAHFDFDRLAGGVQSIELPNTLTSLFGKVFSGCKNLDTLVLPESVTVFENAVVKNSGIKTIYFNGGMPRGFSPDEFDGVVWVRKVGSVV